MNARDFLVRGLLAGLIAGAFAFLVGYAVGEPPIDRAIALETSATTATGAAHTHADDAHHHSHGDEEGGGVTRSTQRTWGLATATVAVGVALGGIVSLLAAGLAGRLGRLPLVGSTALVTALGFVAYALVPFLKYPAAPPAVGSAETIGERTTYYFAFALVSVVAMVAVVAMARALTPRLGSYAAVVASGAAYVVVVTVAALAMPTVNEIGNFPADVLWEFRISALLTLAALWGSLGVALTWLVGRLEVAQRVTA